MRLWGLILIILGFGLGCREEKKLDEGTLESLKTVTRGLLHENTRINDRFHFAEGVYPHAKPYAELAKKLNSCFYSYIDSSLKLPFASDTASLIKRLKELEAAYLKIFLASQNDKRTILLKDDVVAFGLKNIYFNTPRTISFELNYYLMIQKTLVKHLACLQILLEAYGSGCYLFTRWELMGKTITVVQHEKTTDISFFFHYSKHDLLYELQSEIDLLSSFDEKIVPLKKEIVADTAHLSVTKLNSGKYVLNVKYKRFYDSGSWEIIDLPFPFTIK